MRRLTTTFVTSAALAVLAGAACRDATAPVDERAPLLSGLLTGDVTVGTTTTGVDLDADGYAVTLDLLLSQPAPTNGSVTFRDVVTGVHVVHLNGVAGNCTVSGGDSRTLMVLLSATVRVDFTITCTPTTGDLAVTTVTTGSDLDPDGYTVTVDGVQPKAIGINETVTFTKLSPGDHSASLSGVAGNCTVSGGNLRTVAVSAGGTAATQFDVSCGGAPPPPPPTGTQVTGRGAIGPGTATPGSTRQDFDFDVASNLSGRVFIRDWSVVRPDGTVGTLTVDPSTDPATGITEFRDGSATCEDPTRGAEFKGVGRVNTGGDSNPGGSELLSFTVTTCDNGTPGVGLDLFGAQVPGHGYQVGPDRLSEGDLSKSTS